MKWKDAPIKNGFIKIDLKPHKINDGVVLIALRLKNNKPQYQVKKT